MSSSFAWSNQDSLKKVQSESALAMRTSTMQLNCAATDCKSRGFLLDGFPRTKAQADALAAAGVVADMFVLLEVPDELLVARVVGRRSDPGASIHSFSCFASIHW